MQYPENELTVKLKKVAIRYLSHRSYTEYELRQKLSVAFLKYQAPIINDNKLTLELKAQQSIIQVVIDYCYHYQWLNDSKYVTDYFYYRSHRGYGFKRIQLELQQRGISDVLLESYQQNCQLDWQTILQRLVHKKFPKIFEPASSIDHKMKVKIAHYLSARGFSFEQINFLFSSLSEP